MLRRLMMTVLLLVLSIGCASSAPPISIDRFHRADRTTSTAYPGAEAVHLLNRFQIQMGFSEKKRKPFAHVVHLQRIQILKEAGLKYARAVVPFDVFSQILNIQGRVYKEDCRIIDMDPDHFSDVPFFEKDDPALRIYSEKGLRVFKVPGVEVGDVVELVTLRVYRDARWLQPLQMNGRIPVVRAEVVLDAPDNFDLDMRVMREGQVQTLPIQSFSSRWKDPNGVEVKGKRKSMQLAQMRPILSEELQAPLPFLATQVFVALRSYDYGGQSYRGFWRFQDVSDWFFALTSSQQKEDDRLTTAVQQALGAGRSKAEIIAYVQRFLQDNVRNVKSYSHLGVFKGRTPWDIWRFKIGDSKDQAILGQHMLRAMGYQSLLVLVADRQSVGQISDLPSPAPYNHVLIAVPQGGDYIFIDPEGERLPVGMVSSATAGLQGLLLAGDNTQFVNLPAERASDNSTALTVLFSMDTMGMATGQLTLEVQGRPAAELRTRLLQMPNQRAEAVAGWLWETQRAGSLLKEVQVTHLSEPQKTLKITGQYGPVRLGPRAPQSITVTASPLMESPWQWIWRQKRHTSLALAYPRNWQIKTQWRLPQGWGLNGLPENWEIASFALSSKAEWFLANGLLEHQMVWTQDKREIVSERYSEAIVPATILTQKLKQEVRLVKGGAQGADYDGTPF